MGVTEYAGLTSYTGGIGRHYASLLPALVRQGIDIDLVLFVDDPRLDDALVAKAELGGVTLVRRFGRAPGPGWLQPIVRGLRFRREARRLGPNRIFLPEWAGLGALLRRKDRPVTNLATSMRLSNEVSGVPSSALPRDRRAVAAVQSWCEDRQIRRSVGLVPISRAMLERNRALLGVLPPSVVVRNCIDVDDVRAAAAEVALPGGWPVGDEPVALFLGRLERKKGVEVAARAFALVARKHPTVRFVFAGSSGDSRFEPTRQHLLALLPEEVRGRVVFLGHVDGTSLYRGIAASTVVVCPSLWEGFGQVALEAKALGAPVVVTSGSGYDDFCADGVDSLVVPPGDPLALASAVERILGDPELAEALVRGATGGISAFTADAVAPDVVAAVTGFSRSSGRDANR